MGVRFRKRIRLAPGLHLNLSGSGLSWSVGPRGASMSFGSRGTYLNTGLPGTGLYARERIGTSSNTPDSPPISNQATQISVKASVQDDGTMVFLDENGNPLDDFLIKKAKEQNKEALQDLMSRACEEINGQIEALERIHVATPAPDEHPVYQIQPFPKPTLTKPSPKKYGIWGTLFSSVRKRIDQENANLQVQYIAELKTWEEEKLHHEARESAHKMLIEKRVLTELAAMEIVLEESLKDIDWPRETQVSSEIRGDGAVVMIDIDLPEIEDMPKKTAAIPGRGYKLSVKEISATRLRQLYARHIHAVGMRVIGEILSVLPNAESVVLSGYSQRTDKSTGAAQDDYLYSVRVRRHDWAAINFSNLQELDAVAALERFDLRRDLSKSGVFQPIMPFEGNEG